jgi:hypothetical protein
MSRIVHFREYVKGKGVFEFPSIVPFLPLVLKLQAKSFLKPYKGIHRPFTNSTESSEVAKTIDRLHLQAVADPEINQEGS